MSDKRNADQANLDAALSLIRKSVPRAVSIDLGTSDQNTYGFVLMEINMNDGSVLSEFGAGLQFDTIDDSVSDLLSDIDWNGVVAEDKYGFATVTL